MSFLPADCMIDLVVVVEMCYTCWKIVCALVFTAALVDDGLICLIFPLYSVSQKCTNSGELWFRQMWSNIHNICHIQSAHIEK